MAREGILLQIFLDERRKTIETFAHVAVTQRQMCFHARRNDDHDAFSLPAKVRLTLAADAPTGANTRRPQGGGRRRLAFCSIREFDQCVIQFDRHHAVRRPHEIASSGALRAVRPNSSRQP